MTPEMLKSAASGRADNPSRAFPLRIRIGAVALGALCVSLVLANGAVRANTAWTHHLRSDLKTMETRLSLRLVHRGDQKADQLAVRAGDRDDYVQLLAGISDAQVPSRQ